MTRTHRLSRSRDFDAVYRHGRAVSTRHLTLYVFARSDEEDARLGLVVSRQAGGAVERNRLKRRLREAFARTAEDVPAGRDYVLIARPGLAEAAESKGLSWLSERLSEVFSLAAGSGGGRP